MSFETRCCWPRVARCRSLDRYAAPAVTFRLVRGVSLSGDWGSPTSAAGQPHSADALFGD
jgi:hypothetical protein